MALTACLRSAPDNQTDLELEMQAVMQHFHRGCHCLMTGLSWCLMMMKAHAPLMVALQLKWQPKVQVRLCLNQSGFDLAVQACSCHPETCASSVLSKHCHKTRKLHVGRTGNRHWPLVNPHIALCTEMCFTRVTSNHLSHL